MLEKAYCYETNSVIPARYAHTQKYQREIDDHYFCTVEECNVLVVPKISESGNYFYAAQPHGHHRSCEHYHAPSDGGDIRGIARQKPSEKFEAFIPTALEPVLNNPLVRRVMACQPTPQEIAEMVQSAVAAIVPGTLKEVVNAWHDLKGIDKTEYPLLIDGHWLSYENAFWNIYQAEQVVDVPWAWHIVWGFVDITAGEYKDVYFLKTMKKFPLDNKWSAVHFTKKANLTLPVDFANAGVRCNIFWHGSAPVVANTKYELNAQNHDHFLYLAPV
ncbi:MAG: hypothetical protein WC216_06040 [Gallionella sp.]|jgi:hypothetical protein